MLTAIAGRHIEIRQWCERAVQKVERIALRFRNARCVAVI
jgi:hypothetical protein